MNHQETELILQRIKLNHFSYSSTEEALNYANIKIAANKDQFIYIIDVPITTNITFDVMTLRSNAMSKPTLDLIFKKIFYNNQYIYGVKDTCETINKLELCKTNQLVDITNTSCIPNLIHGIHATCAST